MHLLHVALVAEKHGVICRRTHTVVTKVAMPEWLRGLTRNQMRSPRVGSNPTGDESFCVGDAKCVAAQLVANNSQVYATKVLWCSG